MSMQSFTIILHLLVGISCFFATQAVDVEAQVDSTGATSQSEVRTHVFVRREVSAVTAPAPAVDETGATPIVDPNKQLQDGGTVIVNSNGKFGSPGHQLQSRLGNAGATASLKRTITPSTILIGSFVLVMLCINMATSGNPNIKQTTCQVMSNMIAFICALLLYNIFRDLTNLLLGDQAATSVSEILLSNPTGTGSGGPPSVGEIWISIGRFLFFFLVLQVFFVKMRTKTQWLQSAGFVGGYFVAFLGADAFATTQESAPWNGNLGYNFAWVVISTCIVLVLVCIAGAVRTRVATPSQEESGASQEGGEAQNSDWTQYAAQSDDAITAVAIGLVWAQWFRFALVGRLPHFRGIQVNNDSGQIWGLWGIGAGAALLAFAATFGLSRMQEPGSMMKRALSMKIKGLSMVSAWCFLYFGRWYHQYLLLVKDFFAGGDTVTAQMWMVLNLVFWAFTSVCALSMLARKNEIWKPARDSLSQGAVLCAALGWETLILTATKADVLTSTTSGTQKRTMNADFNYLLLGGVLLITWVKFFLPLAQSVGDDWIAATDGDEAKAESKDIAGTGPSPDDKAAAPAATPAADEKEDKKDDES